MPRATEGGAQREDPRRTKDEGRGKEATRGNAKISCGTDNLVHLIFNHRIPFTQHERAEKQRSENEKRAKQRAEVQARVQSDLQRAAQHAEEEREREEASGGRRKGAKHERERDVSPDSAGEDREPVEKRKKLRKQPSSTKSRDADNNSEKKRGGGKGRPRGIQSQLSAEFVSDSSDEGEKEIPTKTNAAAHDDAESNGKDDQDTDLKNTTNGTAKTNGTSPSHETPASAASTSDDDERPRPSSGEKRRHSDDDDVTEENGHYRSDDEDHVRVRPRLSKIRRTVADSDDEDEEWRRRAE
ncbi:hypothetical protein BC832DRAFT_474648 [Gaertneriomyces semiglobifer]|nr:hypothetical protein BC832DRAFT_474648 [Gaertneriomyces semiglobifer]